MANTTCGWSPDPIEPVINDLARPSISLGSKGPIALASSYWWMAFVTPALRSSAPTCWKHARLVRAGRLSSCREYDLALEYTGRVVQGFVEHRRAASTPAGFQAPIVADTDHKSLPVFLQEREQLIRVSLTIHDMDDLGTVVKNLACQQGRVMPTQGFTIRIVQPIVSLAAALPWTVPRPGETTQATQRLARAGDAQREVGKKALSLVRTHSAQPTPWAIPTEPELRGVVNHKHLGFH